jgi:hypothetical protein
MESADHRMTASWGSSIAARAYRAEQAMLVAQGDAMGALEMDLYNVMDLFGVKYLDAILEAMRSAPYE